MSDYKKLFKEAKNRKSKVIEGPASLSSLVLGMRWASFCNQPLLAWVLVHIGALIEQPHNSR